MVMSVHGIIYMHGREAQTKIQRAANRRNNCQFAVVIL